MVERLTITAMGKQRLVERLADRIFGALYNLPLEVTDDYRSKVAAAAVILEGEYLDVPDHGSWHDKSGHQ